MSNLIDSPKLSIEKLLNDPVPLQVPPWQRFYSWTATEIEEYWYDTTHYAERYQPGSSDYFIGTVIVVSPSGRLERLLLDGQQRLATSVILLASLRDAVTELSLQDPSLRGLDGQIDERCIKTKNFSSNADQRRLTLTQQDDHFFERHIVGNAALTVTERRLKSSQRLLWRAKNFFASKIAEEKANRTPDAYKAFIVQLQQRIRDNVVAIAVTMDDEDNAISVFETLNDRGVSLSTSELVRAYLLQKAPQNRQNIIALWQTIFDLEGQPRHKNLLRHLWVSGHGDVKERALSKTIKDELDRLGGSAATAITFAQDMADKATRYADLVAGNTSDADLNLILREVIALGAQSLYPALISATEKWPNTTTSEKQAIRDYARALVNGYFRHVTIGDREGTKFEKLVYGQAKQIADSLLDSAGAVQQVKAFVSNDADFEAEFKVKSVSSGVAQYIMRKFEDALRGPGSAMQVGAPRNAHVEHVYPQNPIAAQKWADHDDWVNRIGNLALLSGTVNRSLSNADYATKRPEYQTSGVLISEEIARNYTSWGSTEIDSRQSLMATTALAIWAL